MAVWGKILNKPKYLTVYDAIVVCVITMLMFMIFASYQIQSLVIVILLTLKMLLGLAFIKAEKTKWIKVYFYARLLYDIVIICFYCLIAVGSRIFGALNATVALIFIAASEGILYSFIFHYLKSKETKTFIPELLEIETAKRKLQNFYDLANLERSEIRDINSSSAEMNPLQRMIKNNDREREIDIEQRFQFRKLPVYHKETNTAQRNHPSRNELDSILDQYNTSSDNLQMPASRVSFDSRARADFAIQNHDISDKNFQSISNIPEEKNPSSLIMVDVFQRFRDQPKVTRELPSLKNNESPSIKKGKKVDPSKNRRKIDETILSTFEDKRKRSRSHNTHSKVLDLGEKYTKYLINKGVIYSKTHTGAFVLIPNLPSLHRPSHLRDNFMDSV
ncbi:unnamed protein product [Moneuplotes crassus]|uniref:Uncharacterized protein n=2 Tax=Euplotes crassus TaxID=5936 RepID=A0AAD1XG37_EUPCR|nr:unnamed protein product [Moneuplotes crassus]